MDEKMEITAASPPDTAAKLVSSINPDTSSSDCTSLLVTCKHLCTPQKADMMLKKYLSSVPSVDKASGEKVAYCLDKDILVR